MDNTNLLFLGVSACFPDIGGDTASFCLGDELLIDTGWYANQRLRAAGIAPASIKYICISHTHHDHILGLPAMIYEHYRANTIEGLNIFGPKETIGRTVKDALSFIDSDYYWPKAGRPLVRELEENDWFETPSFEIAVHPADHTVPGRCFKVKDKRSDILIGFTGDGSYQNDLAGFFKGCDVIVHEFSFGLETPQDNSTKHSSIPDAIRCADEAGVKIVCLVHGPSVQSEQYEICRKEAEKLFNGSIHWPNAGQILSFMKSL